MKIYLSCDITSKGWRAALCPHPTRSIRSEVKQEPSAAGRRRPANPKLILASVPNGRVQGERRYACGTGSARGNVIVRPWPASCRHARPTRRLATITDPTPGRAPPRQVGGQATVERLEPALPERSASPRTTAPACCSLPGFLADATPGRAPPQQVGGSGRGRAARACATRRVGPRSAGVTSRSSPIASPTPPNLVSRGESPSKGRALLREKHPCFQGS